jgi:Asp-tRNA(Asn)/Glu-tRNA(Gln) amidotransferase A subunit family amidase
MMNKTAQYSENLPVCLQVVGHSHEDEKVLGIMKMLEQSI